MNYTNKCNDCHTDWSDTASSSCVTCPMCNGSNITGKPVELEVIIIPELASWLRKVIKYVRIEK